MGVIPSITGKVELVYEGEQEGPGIVAQNLVGKAIRTQFVNYFPDPEKFRKAKDKNPYKKIIAWFSDGNSIDLLGDITNQDYEKTLKAVPGLSDLVNEFQKAQETTTKLFLMEFALHGLADTASSASTTLQKDCSLKISSAECSAFQKQMMKILMMMKRSATE